MPEFLCNKDTGLEPAIWFILKKTSAQVFTCKFYKIFHKTYLWRKFASSCFWKCFFYITLLDDCFYIFEDLTRHFRPRLVHWNESVYCIPIDRALKMRFNEGSSSFLRPVIPELWWFLCEINWANFWTKQIHKYKKIFNIFITKRGFLASKKHQKIQFWVKWLHNIYLTIAKSRTLSVFTKNTQI